MNAAEIEVVGTLIDDLKGVQSIEEDLKFVSRAIDEFEGRRVRGGTTADLEAVDIVAWALWNAIVVAYARCFNVGSRKAIGNQLKPPLDQSLTELHRNLLRARDGHVAHATRDSKEEVQRAFLVLHPANPGVRLAGLKTTFGQPGTMPLLRRLLNHFKDELRALDARLTAEFQERVLQMPLAELEQLAARGTPLRFDHHPRPSAETATP